MMFVSHAQNFEDVILHRALGHVENGTYLDVGAHDPVIDSVSLAFYERGWRGVHVEPARIHADRLRAARPDEVVIEAAVGQAGVLEFHEFPETGLSTGVRDFAERHVAAGHERVVQTLPVVPLSRILSRFEDDDLHWLKIDVEGMEGEVIDSWAPSPVRPWVLVIEATEPNSARTNHEGWDPVVRELGYDFVYFDGLNRFYVSHERPELKDAFGAGPNFFDHFSIVESSPFAGALRARIKQLVSENEESCNRARRSEDRADAASQEVASLRTRLQRLTDDGNLVAIEGQRLAIEGQRLATENARLAADNERLAREAARRTPRLVRDASHAVRDSIRTVRGRNGSASAGPGMPAPRRKAPRVLRSASHALRDALRAVRGRKGGQTVAPPFVTADRSFLSEGLSPARASREEVEWFKDQPPRLFPPSARPTRPDQLPLRAPDPDALLQKAIERRLAASIVSRSGAPRSDGGRDRTEEPAA